MSFKMVGHHGLVIMELEYEFVEVIPRRLKGLSAIACC
jgi:hypothetical protein